MVCTLTFTFSFTMHGILLENYIVYDWMITLTPRIYDQWKTLCSAILLVYNAYYDQSKAYHKLNQMHSLRLGIAHLHCFHVPFALRLGILGRAKRLTLLHPYKGSRAVKALVKSNTKYTRVCEFSRRITTDKISITGIWLDLIADVDNPRINSKYFLPFARRPWPQKPRRTTIFSINTTTLVAQQFKTGNCCADYSCAHGHTFKCM